LNNVKVQNNRGGTKRKEKEKSRSTKEEKNDNKKVISALKRIILVF